VPEITKVRTEYGPGAEHEHISMVEIESGDRYYRSTIITHIRQGYHFWTYGGGQYADVVVRGCPVCGSGDYITTLPDSTTANNLLSLPRF